MNKKKIIMIAVAAVIFITGYTAMSIFTQKELASYELEFLKCFGDVNSDVTGGNHLMVDLVVRTDLYNIRKIVDQLNESEEIKFDNEAVKIHDFIFIEGDLKYGTLKEIMLSITYSAEGKTGEPLEVNKIFVKGKAFDIGSISFIPAEFTDNQVLQTGGYSGTVVGVGLPDYEIGLENNGEEKLEVDEINLKRFKDHIAQIVMRRGNDDFQLKAPNYGFSIDEQEQKVGVTVQFDTTDLEEYDVFYFSPSILYHTEDGVSHRLDLYVYTSGLLLNDEDLRKTRIRK